MKKIEKKVAAMNLDQLNSRYDQIEIEIEENEAKLYEKVLEHLIENDVSDSRMKQDMAWLFSGILAFEASHVFLAVELPGDGWLNLACSGLCFAHSIGAIIGHRVCWEKTKKKMYDERKRYYKEHYNEVLNAVHECPRFDETIKLENLTEELGFVQKYLRIRRLEYIAPNNIDR